MDNTTLTEDINHSMTRVTLRNKCAPEALEVNQYTYNELKWEWLHDNPIHVFFPSPRWFANVRININDDTRQELLWSWDY